MNPTPPAEGVGALWDDLSIGIAEMLMCIIDRVKRADNANMPKNAIRYVEKEREVISIY